MLRETDGLTSTVLFVCLHGSAKSLIAAEHLSRLAAVQGIAVRGESAGLEPDADVPPAVVLGLARDRRARRALTTTAKRYMMPQQRVALSKVGSGILIAIASVLPSIAIAQAPNRGAPPVLRTVAEIPLTGPAVRFDYQTLDTLSNRLYIAHMDADQLVVVDLAKRAVVATLNGFDRVHGVIVAPDIGRVYASATGRHEVMAVDVRSLALVAHIGPITYPNGLAYAPDVQRVFVSDNAGTEAVIDAKSNRLITSIQLGAGAGNTVYDPVTRRILVARHRENDLVAIDPATATIIGRVALPGIGNSHGVVLDAARRLAFVAGTANATLGVVDLDSMRLTHTYRVARSPDVLAFDPGWRRVYVSSESGGVTVLREIDTPNGIALRHEGDLAMPHAHTVAVDPRTHLVYFPLHEVNGRPVLRNMVGQPPP